ncbi:MAG: LysM peptidoglycan-binding domain-containing protein [Clostridiaceae bacterium]|nr:LysM peptidoglycan-binding domain-containing protein [Clostridiaceae bacterium]
MVQAGDSLWKIAQKHQVTVDELIKTNNIFSPDIIVPGLRLPIPVKKIETPMITYVISSGDSLWKIAQQYKVTVADLVKKNNITSPDIILPGQSLMIPVNEEIEKQPISHTVATGDTLWLIAQKYHTTIDEITQKNNITNPNNILVGQKLIIQ